MNNRETRRLRNLISKCGKCMGFGCDGCLRGEYVRLHCEPEKYCVPEVRAGWPKIMRAMLTDELIYVLHKYDHTIPTGSTLGKLWLRREYDRRKKIEKYYLGMYHASPDPGYVDIWWYEVLPMAGDIKYLAPGG